MERKQECRLLLMIWDNYSCLVGLDEVVLCDFFEISLPFVKGASYLAVRNMWKGNAIAIFRKYTSAYRSPWPLFTAMLCRNSYWDTILHCYVISVVEAEISIASVNILKAPYSFFSREFLGVLQFYKYSGYWHLRDKKVEKKVRAIITQWNNSKLAWDEKIKFQLGS